MYNINNITEQMNSHHINSIREYHKRWGILPSLVDICSMFNFKSRTSAWKLREKLVEDGYLGKNPNYYPTEKFLNIQK